MAGQSKSDDTDRQREFIEAAARGLIHNVRTLHLNFQVDINSCSLEGCTALYAACQNGRLEVARALIAAGADVDLSFQGFTPLAFAVRHRRVEIALALIKANTDVDMKDPAGSTPLMYAVKSGNVALVRALIEKKALLDEVDGNGWTALMLAVRHSAMCVVALLCAGADPTVVASDGNTAISMAQSRIEIADTIQQALTEWSNPRRLHESARAGKLGLVRAFLRDHISLEDTNHEKQTALMIAAHEGHHQIVRTLVEANANKEATDASGRTALLLAVSSGRIKATCELIQAGANLEAADASGETALSLAMSSGQTEIVRALVTAGASSEAKDMSGQTALMIAACSGHLDIVQMLIERSADLDVTTQTGETACLLAASNGHTEIVRALIEANADFEAENSLNQTALLLAAFHGHHRTVDLLLGFHADVNQRDSNGVTALMLAVLSNSYQIAKSLLRAGADPAIANNQSTTALELASTKGCSRAIIKLLESALRKNSKVSKPSPPSPDSTSRLCASVPIQTISIHSASSTGQVEIIRELIESCADLDALDESGMTALMHAAANGQEEVVGILLEANPNMDATNKRGQTALIMAAARGHVGVVTKLLHAGVDMDAVDNNGNTALILAAASDHDDIVESLLQAGADAAIVNKLGATALDVGRARRVSFVIVKALQSVLLSEVAGVPANDKPSSEVGSTVGDQVSSSAPTVFSFEAYIPTDVKLSETMKQRSPVNVARAIDVKPMLVEVAARDGLLVARSLKTDDDLSEITQTVTVVGTDDNQVEFPFHHAVHSSTGDASSFAALTELTTADPNALKPLRLVTTSKSVVRMCAAEFAYCLGYHEVGDMLATKMGRAASGFNTSRALSVTALENVEDFAFIYAVDATQGDATAFALVLADEGGDDKEDAINQLILVQIEREVRTEEVSWSPLELAVQVGYLEIASYLLNRNDVVTAEKKIVVRCRALQQAKALGRA